MFPVASTSTAHASQGLPNVHWREPIFFSACAAVFSVTLGSFCLHPAPIA